jgi:translation initiation factor IF-1
LVGLKVIRGKIKRRMWIRDHDLVLIAPWDFFDWIFVEYIFD